MFFSLPIFGQALLLTVITVAAVFAVRFVVARKAPSGRVLAITAFSSLLVNLVFTYNALPAHTGAMYGLWWYLAFTLVAVGVVQVLAYMKADNARGGRWDRDEKATRNPDLAFKPIVLLGTLAVTLLLVLPIGQIFLHQWPFGDAKEWSKQANIEIAGPDETLPQTDNKHIVMVDRDVALYLAQAKMGQDNLGSKYKLEKDDFVKQSIAGHLYWVCPLEYKSGWTQFWDGISGGQSFPGFVIVDAENPDPKNVELVHNLDLHYTNRAMFDHNIIRHLYAAGYTSGNLTAPTIELDDNRKPFITVTYTRPQFVTGGESTVSVLVVDMKNGAIQEYAIDKVPAWVDRVVGEDMAEAFANNWGFYHDDRTGWTTGTFNGGAYQMKVYSTFLQYNNVDAPVYHILMTSNDNSNHSATGVLVYDTRAQKGKFYPGLAGINLDVDQTFRSIPENNNGTGNKQVTEGGLYNVNGRVTWIGVFTSPQQIGRSFSGLGMLDAAAPNPTNVAYGENKTVALRKYETYLGSGNPNGTGVKDTQTTKSVTGVVTKANWVNGKLYLVLNDDTGHRFAATQDVAGGADLVEVVVGEKITLEYKDFGAREV